MPSTGVLLIQLGTPDAPTTPALRRYLRQFLNDPRVIEARRLPWWFVLNFFILPFRPRQSAAKYRRIWHPETGSPLLHYTRRQAEALQALLPEPCATRVHRTTSALVKRLGWPRDRCTETFQSLFGRDEWLKPYTDNTLRRLAGRGVQRAFVATPGFTTDCLETIDEIGREARE